MQSLSKYRTPLSPKTRQGLSPVQELSPAHEFEESTTSTTPAIVKGFSFSLPPTPQRSLTSSSHVEPPTTRAFKAATPLPAEEILLEGEDEEEEEEEGRGMEVREGVVPTSTHEFVVDEKELLREATPTSTEATPIPEVIVTPEPEELEDVKVDMLYLYVSTTFLSLLISLLRMSLVAQVVFTIKEIMTSLGRCWWACTTRTASCMSMWREAGDWQLLTVMATLIPTSRPTFFPTKPNTPNRRPVSKRRRSTQSTMKH